MKLTVLNVAHEGYITLKDEGHVRSSTCNLVSRTPRTMWRLPRRYLRCKLLTSDRNLAAICCGYAGDSRGGICWQIDMYAVLLGTPQRTCCIRSQILSSGVPGYEHETPRRS